MGLLQYIFILKIFITLWFMLPQNPDTSHLELPTQPPMHIVPTYKQTDDITYARSIQSNHYLMRKTRRSVNKNDII